jgi:hypothetical protein
MIHKSEKFVERESIKVKAPQPHTMFDGWVLLSDSQVAIFKGD